MRRPIDSSDSIERATGGPLCGPVAAAMYLRSWVAAVVSRRAFLQSQVPLLTKQAATGLVARFTPPTQQRDATCSCSCLGTLRLRRELSYVFSRLIGNIVSCPARTDHPSCRTTTKYTTGPRPTACLHFLGDVKASLFEPRACWHLYLWWQTSSLLRGLHFNPRLSVDVSYLLSNIYIYTSQNRGYC